MILNSAPQNEAVLSNVGEIGEFRIRNSAKAFNILSSGLYSNKIKAVIRELSCNAVDAHVAAGKKDVPFEVHLPNSLEPWFSVRDYGIGLNHDQVTNIYTTYFESTKTNSNDFVGGLGLGSKSPFSYTDNFTVTAVKDGRKGIYTAFINDAGVPSIALMTEEQTTEDNGVEVKFSVNERYDFEKFRSESQNVFCYFEIKPTVKGYNDYKPKENKYDVMNIIPGVHSYHDGAYMSSSRAVMGNIAYPIEVPNASLVLGEDLVRLLKCGLEMHFEIGELDFQASREGLSYIAPTIAAIKAKLQAVVAKLSIHLAIEANSIQNMWKRSIFLYGKKRNSLWSTAVEKYVNDTKFPLFAANWSSTYDIKLFAKDLAKDYNILVRGFTYHGGKCSTMKYALDYDGTENNGIKLKSEGVHFTVSNNVTFIKNDTNIGALERAKYHWRNSDDDMTSTAYVLEIVDKTKPAKYDEFFKAISNPPDEQIMLASTLEEKPRSVSGVGKAVNLLEIFGKAVNSWSSAVKYNWQSAGQHTSLDKTKTYYYIPLKGFELKSKYGYNGSGGDLYELLKKTGIPGLCDIKLYGVRKGDMEAIEAEKNWVNIEDHIVAILSNIPTEVVMAVAKNSVMRYNFMKYDSKLYSKLDAKSPILKLHKEFDAVKDLSIGEGPISSLAHVYTPNNNIDLTKSMDKYTKECDDIHAKYPMLTLVSPYEHYTTKIVDYINMIEFVAALQKV